MIRTILFTGVSTFSTRWLISVEEGGPCGPLWPAQMGEVSRRQSKYSEGEMPNALQKGSRSSADTGEDM